MERRSVVPFNIIISIIFTIIFMSHLTLFLVKVKQCIHYNIIIIFYYSRSCTWSFFYSSGRITYRVSVSVYQYKLLSCSHLVLYFSVVFLNSDFCYGRIFFFCVLVTSFYFIRLVQSAKISVSGSLPGTTTTRIFPIFPRPV